MNSFSIESSAHRPPEKEKPILSSKIIDNLKRMGPSQLHQAMNLLNALDVEGLNDDELMDIRKLIWEIFVQKITKKLDKMDPKQLKKTLNSLEAMTDIGAEGLSKTEISEIRNLISKTIVHQEGGIVEFRKQKKPKGRKKNGNEEAELIDLSGKREKPEPAPIKKTGKTHLHLVE